MSCGCLGKRRISVITDCVFQRLFCVRKRNVEFIYLAFLENILANKQTPEPLFVHPEVSDKEALLNCTQCHSNDDRHLGLFGEDCVQCHSTDKWSLPKFIHPSSQSRDCNQCHEAPPSHYMQHFKMISAKVAGEPKAKVEECYACHQSTSWNDIKRAGWYKHH